jgi:transcriptional regulator with XRE-family HTH domain
MDKIQIESNEQNKNEVGRPRIIIDEKVLANLASIGCTIEECASVLGVSARTLSRNYAEIIEENKNKGKASLRKKMFDKAMKHDNTHMQIWLSKNYLGMKDRTVNETITEPLPLIIEAQVVDGEES